MIKIILTSLFILSYSFSNEISGVTYFEYSEDVFSISRTYFTYKKTISDELSFVLQTDIGKVGDDDRSTVYLKKAGHFKIFDEVASEFLSEENLPALECVLIPKPGPVHDAVVQIEAIGFRN